MPIKPAIAATAVVAGAVMQQIRIRRLTKDRNNYASSLITAVELNESLVAKLDYVCCIADACDVPVDEFDKIVMHNL